MAKGRKKLPDQLKVVQGTFRKHRGKTADSQDDAPMVAPGGLSEAAQRHFETLRDRVAVLGLDSATYSEALALAAMRMAEIDECEAIIRSHGAVVLAPTTTGGELLRPNPAVTMRNEAMRHLQSLLAEFGLTPSSIGRVGVKKKEPAKQQGFGGL
jgi:P27 family predicted phage terminase small subunit